jgi:dTDP-glucose 4,6-dehydratase
MHPKLSKVLVTGGAGFIGSEFVRQGVRQGGRITVVDGLTYAGDRARLKEVSGKIAFVKADITCAKKMTAIVRRVRPDIIVHFAAETHVDRSIQNAHPFLSTNVGGTLSMLEAGRAVGIKKFVHISTDEVYGDIERGFFKETSPFAPNSPYAASKAAADLLVRSYVRTYGFPAVTVRPSNNYGPWQYPEKLIPVIILKALNDERVPVYARGLNRREWLHVSDCSRAVWRVVEKGVIGEAYNVGSGQERKNIDTVRAVLRALGKSASLIQFVKDRPGHDVRYALDFSKVRRLGWEPRVGFDDGIASVVAWNLAHRAWLQGQLAVLKTYWRRVYKSR